MGSLFGDDDENLDIIADAVEQEVDAAAPEAPVELTPRDNPDFFGHDAVEKSLLEDYTTGRMPHALILAGPPGIGKATLAYRLARFLFAQPQSPTSLRTDPSSAVFRRVVSGGHADLLTIEREFDEKKDRFKNEISVDAVRRVHPFLRMTAAEGGWRVVIVDSAEYLNANSQNALLKILEEPPEKTMLILTTSQPGSFLPTIRSRCRMVHMDALSETVMGKLLDKMAPGLSSSDKLSLSRLSQGSIGKALQFHKDGGLALYKELIAVVATVPELDMVKVHDLAEKIGKYGAEQAYNTAMDIMTGWCERHARATARGQEMVDVLPGDATVFKKMSGIYPPKHFLDAWEKISQLVLQVDSYNLDKRQAVIGAFLALQKPDYQGLNI